MAAVGSYTATAGTVAAPLPETGEAAWYAPLRGVRRDVAAAALPPEISSRSFGPAWCIAVLAHVGIAAWAMTHPSSPPPPAEPPVRLVFLEPPPPPPPPLGVPGGQAAAPAPIVPAAPKVVVAPKKERLRAPRTDTKPVRKTPPQVRPKPQPRPEPAPVQPAAPVAAAAAPAGVATGSLGGVAGGVAGGVVGGTSGGVAGGSGAGPLPAGKVAHPPVLVRRIAPVYPQQARRRSIEGLVLLEAILDREGRVEPDVKVLESVPMLDREAVSAVRQWRFRPARNQHGEPLRVILEIPIRFVLR